MSSHKYNRSDKHRKREYIPEEKYDIDGTLIKNHAAFKNKRWDLKEIINNPNKYREAIKEAQQYLKKQKEEISSIFDLESARPWTEESDDLFFSRRRRGLVSWIIPTGSPIYYEFEDSINKGKVHNKDDGSGRMDKVRQEGEMLRHSLVLFQDFQAKKMANIKKKIEETRASLPITPFANAIVQTLLKNRILLIAGDTGCGKSTQVPQILMKAGFNKIACTQPRRIACSSLARRVSYETLNEYGSQVAYQVRFEGNKTNRTRVLFLTEGLLLRQYAADNMLSMYDVIVVDEVHERHMMGDFLLALLKKTLAQRKDLYVVLMSATINAELFAQYFNAPTLIVPGKMYSVKTHYWSQGDDDKNLVDEAAYQKRQSETVKKSIPSRSQPVNAAPYIKVLDYIDQSVPLDERGDLLIFMSGINEICSLAEELTIYALESKKWIILTLHSSLAVEDQEKVFDSPPEGFRKCIISSNIAETSLTIDGIRFIVDSGKVKEMNHDPASKMSRLSEFWISKASAKQRAGRAGRTGPGECFRLYSENEFNHFHDFAIPEIQRAPLEPLLLQIKSLELGNPRQFDYIEMPSMDFINASMDFLHNLGAIDKNENLLGLGFVLAELPVDSVVGKMLIMGVVFNIVDPTITIAAGMSVQSPFTRVTHSTNPEVLKNRSQFDSKHGDPFTLLNVWKSWLMVKGDKKNSSRKWCRENGVEEQRLYEIAKMKRQFEKVLNDFQPGLLQSLLATNTDDDNRNSQDDNRNKYAAREKLRRERYDQKSKKRKRVLEIVDYSRNDDPGLDKESENEDIRHLEFSLMNNMKSLQSRATSLSDKDIELVKLVICSSLYPQLAIGDEHNAYRKSNEIMFNTPAKNFLSLHPSSVVASNPEWVQGLEDHIRKDDRTVEEALYHQLLCYLQLLETSKPYIVNVTRVPGIHVLLLFGKIIDTNIDCSVLIIDSYYMIRFRTTQVAEYVLYLAYKLRSTWNKLLNLRISRGVGKSVGDPLEDFIISPSTKLSLPLTIQQILDDQAEEINHKGPIDMWTFQAEEKYQSQMQSLIKKLAEFMETSISAELRAAKASELLKMYPKYIANSKTENEENFPREWKPKEVIRSGIQITSSIYYNSLDTPSCASSIPEAADSIPSNIPAYWYCQNCRKTFSFRKEQALEHTYENCTDDRTVTTTLTV
ncbi:hypothetical protein INT48_008020 [Thamnidium elegans]|uniref:Uncharacterized protein n=1 Tax=Thamnidium elegans TaxID=101142 RepID=A0A8H7VRR8_9FUNG|nr:hypothetical protein INT48_008020 [Thamnidium elegans]